MDMSHYANRLNERERVFKDLEWEVEERDMMRRAAARPAGRRMVNLSAEIDRYLSDLSS